MARRATAPKVTSAPPTPGQIAGRAVKKIPEAILWTFGNFMLVGVGLGIFFGFVGSFLHSISDGTIPGFGTFFQIGFILGLGGSVILYLRFAGFEDVQEGGRAFIGSLTIGICAAVALSVFLPMFGAHNTLRSLFIGGIAIAAIMAIANIFLKDDYLNVVKWGAILAGAALIGLLAVNGTDGKGFELKSLIPFGGSNNATEEHVPKDVWLSRANPVLYFNNISERSDVFRISSASKRFAWELDESSACGNVIVNGRYPLRNICPGRGTLDLEKEVLLPGEGTTIFQFVGKGMSGKVVSTW